jgi:superfamily II DNA/RNA helicase
MHARSALTELLGEAPAYRWTYIAPRMVRNASAALIDLQQVALSTPTEIPSFSAEALRYANVWESLAGLGEGTTRRTALLNAAASFDLAGYEANAVCLARRLVPRAPELADISADVTGLASLFLQRMFLYVSNAAPIAHAEPDATEMAIEDLYLAAGGALLADGLRVATHGFLAGNYGRLSNAAEQLKQAEEAYAEIGAASEANLARLLRSLLPVMWQRSTWTYLAELHPTRPAWRRYLKLLARGSGKRILTSSSVSELWPSQVTALQAGLLDAQSSKIIRMPTSAGKTRVAELAIVDALLREPGAKCVYVAPFRALVSEVEQTFADLLADLGLRVSSILGTYESDQFEMLLTEDADLVVLTPEKLDLLLRLRSDFLAKVRLIVLDEGHLVHDLNRGAKFELLLTRLKLTLESPRFLVLSAVVPDRTLTDFAIWLQAGANGVITSAWRPSVQQVAALEWRRTTGVLRYSATREEDAIFRQFIPGIIQQRTFSYENPATSRMNSRRFPETGNKGQVAAALAAEFAKIGSVLVFTPIPRNAVSVGKAVETLVQLMELTEEPVPAHFTTPETRSVQVATEWLGSDHDVTRLLRRGIAVHHGQLPDAVKSAMEIDFRERRYRVIVATSTLAQGVNLPLRTVIIHSCWRSDATSRERIPARDYWNIAGRAGRAREETEGTVVHVVMTDQDRRDYAHYLAARGNVEPVESALFQALQSIAQNRFSEAALGEALDAEVLAMAVEESARPEIADFASVINGSLVAVQAGERGLSLAPVSRALTRQRQHILEQVDPQLLPIYSATGLRSASCEHLRSHVLDNAEVLSALLTASTPTPDHSGLADVLLDATADIDEMTSGINYAGDTRALLGAWIAGTAVDGLRRDFAPAAATVEDLTRFIEDFFSYRLPWGFASYLRIAAAVLGIEELGIGAQFFPSMVKFGVPVPEAAWAMAAGVPVRRVAIALASKFLAESPSKAFQDFLEWLGGIDTETLRADFGLSGAILEDVSRAVHRSGRNPLLSTGADTTELLPMTVDVRGISYGNRRFAAHAVQAGEEAELEREYDNLADQNAIRVLINSAELGYLPRHVAQLLAPELDAGEILTATIAEIEQRDVSRVKVTLAIADSSTRPVGQTNPT